MKRDKGLHWEARGRGGRVGIGHGIKRRQRLCGCLDGHKFVDASYIETDNSNRITKENNKLEKRALACW